MASRYPPASAGNSSLFSSGSEWSSGRGGGYNFGSGRSLFTAGGVSRQSSVVLPSASDASRSIRPMTGLAKVKNSSDASSAQPTRMVESVGYYQSMLTSNIETIVAEIDRLRDETEMADCESEARKALDNRHDDMLKAVQKLEGDVADYNLASEYSRSGSSYEDIQRSTSSITSHSKEMEQSIDNIFFSRKKAEDEGKRVEAELTELHEHVESQMVQTADEEHEYRSLVKGIESLVKETKGQEDDMLLLKHKLRTMDDNTQYEEDKKQIEDFKKEVEQVEDEIKLLSMNDAEAHKHLMHKLGSIQDQTKDIEARSSRLDIEIKVLWEMQNDLRSERRMASPGDAERLVKKAQKVKQYLGQEYPTMKAILKAKITQLQSSTKALRTDISERANTTATALPSAEEVELMKDEADFTGKQLDANQQTMALLEQQKKSRNEEVSLTIFVPRCCVSDSLITFYLGRNCSSVGTY